MLDLRIGMALEYFFDHETGAFEVTGHLFGLEEQEVDAHRNSKEFIQVQRPFAQVKREEQHASRPERALDFAQHTGHFFAREMEDGVERKDSRPGVIGRIERPHVADAKIQFRMEPLRSCHHLRRQVDSADLGTVVMDISSDVTRSATQLTGGTCGAYAGRKLLQEMPVEEF